MSLLTEINGIIGGFEVYVHLFVEMLVCLCPQAVNAIAAIKTKSGFFKRLFIPFTFKFFDS